MVQKDKLSFHEQCEKRLRLLLVPKYYSELDDGKLILEKPSFDAVGVFKKIAKKINYNEKIDPHQYEEELKARNP